MEHDAEKIIRQKIKEADLLPLNWDKERVWSSINKTRPAKSNGYVFYYAAASVLLAAAFIFYSIQLTQRETLNKQIKFIELAIEKQANAASTSDPQVCSNNDVERSEPKCFSERKAEEKVVYGELIQIDLTSLLERNDFTDSLLFLQSELTDFPLEVGETIEPIVSQNRIEPIIRDYLPEQKDNAVANRNKRKVKVRFFSPEKQPLDAEASAPFILARIK